MRTALAAVVLAICGCATTGGSPNGDVTNSGRLAGVVKLPEQLTAAQPCDKITVVAMAGDQQVGRVTVRQSRARCSYEITNLPSDVDLSVAVKADGVQCSDGAALGAPASTVKLQDGQIKAQDFTASCGG